MTDILIMNGTGGSGKGTVAEYLKELFEFEIKEYSSIDYVKSVATSTFGWNGIKDVAGRNLLATIKQAMIAYNDLPTKKVIKEIEWATNYGVDILIVDIREPDEIEKLVVYCNLQKIQCVTCRVINTLVEEQAARSGLSLTGDRLYGKYDYDVEIDNNGTKEELKEKVKITFEDVYNKSDEGTGDHVIDSMKYVMKAMSGTVNVVKGKNENNRQLPFSSLVHGRTCSECDSENVFMSQAHNAMVCDFCGQRYNRR